MIAITPGGDNNQTFWTYSIVSLNTRGSPSGNPIQHKYKSIQERNIV